MGKSKFSKYIFGYSLDRNNLALFNSLGVHISFLLADLFRGGVYILPQLGGTC